MPQVIEHGDLTLIYSDIATVSTTISLRNLSVDKPHCFLGVQFFADAEGTTPATPGAGTVTVLTQTINADPLFEAPIDNVIDATDPITVDWAGNSLGVQATPAGITVATHYRIVVSCNKT